MDFKDYPILIVGKISSGKTFLLNKLTGSNFASSTGGTVTLSCQVAKAVTSKRKYIFIDTPGIPEMVEDLYTSLAIYDAHQNYDICCVIYVCPSDNISQSANMKKPYSELFTTLPCLTYLSKYDIINESEKHKFVKAIHSPETLLSMLDSLPLSDYSPHSTLSIDKFVLPFSFDLIGEKKTIKYHLNDYKNYIISLEALTKQFKKYSSDTRDQLLFQSIQLLERHERNKLTLVFCHLYVKGLITDDDYTGFCTTLSEVTEQYKSFINSQYTYPWAKTKYSQIFECPNPECGLHFTVVNYCNIVTCGMEEEKYGVLQEDLDWEGNISYSHHEKRQSKLQGEYYSKTSGKMLSYGCGMVIDTSTLTPIDTLFVDKSLIMMKDEMAMTKFIKEHKLKYKSVLLQITVAVYETGMNFNLFLRNLLKSK